MVVYQMNKLFIVFFTILSILLIKNSTQQTNESKISQMNKVVSTFKAILENIDQNESSYTESQGKKLISSEEITVNKQMLIIPTTNTISSEENFQFEEYFNRSAKERLIGRLLLEKTLDKDSVFYDFISSLPKEFNDYYHFSSNHIDDFDKRSLNKHSFENRQESFDTLVRKIPSNTIPSHMLNFDQYNWASSVVNCFGVVSEKKYFSEVKKLDLYSVSNQDKLSNSKEILLIPGLNLFSKGSFSSYGNINLKSSLFAYKEHIYLNSDRYVDEHQPIYNELQFQSNPDLFEYCGMFVEGSFHEEVVVQIKNSGWNLYQYDLCKSINCVPKNKFSYGFSSINSPFFILKYEFNNKLLTMCSIDQFNSNKTTEEELINTVRLLKNNKKISKNNYMRSLVKCHEYLKDFIKKSNKTPIEQDLKSLHLNKNSGDEKLDLVLKYSISQKKIINYHLNSFISRFIKETESDIFGSIKNNYV